jgi:hypothetical protein
MKSSLKTVLKYYKYASIMYFIGFHICIVIDDWVFTKYISSLSDWVLFFVRPLMFTVTYFVFGSLYFWFLVLFIVFIYQKIYKPRMNM